MQMITLKDSIEILKKAGELFEQGCMLVGRFLGEYAADAELPRNNQAKVISIFPHIDNYIKTVLSDVKESEEDSLKIWENITVRVRPNGLLEHRFNYKGERKSAYGRTKKECWENRERIIANEKKNKKTIKPTVGEWLEQYYNTYKVKKDGTRINPDNERYIMYVKESELGEKRIHQVTGIDIQKFLRNFDDRTNTQHKIKTLLNAAFKKAVPRIIKFNPCDDVEIERHQAESYNVIQPREQNMILKAIDDEKFLTVFWYMCCTGLRLENAIDALNYVDFENCVITPQKKDTATKKHRVRIPFLPELLNPEKVKLIKQCEYRDIEYYFFKLFKKLNLQLVVHSFRKTFASCAYHVGFSDKWIQSCLGHKTLQMTQDTYIELIENEDSPLLDYFRRLKEKLKQIIPYTPLHTPFF